MNKQLEKDKNIKLDQDKQNAREQWEQSPCGANSGVQYEFGTREFFDEVERYRYTQYAAWMPSVMGFTDFPGQRLLEIGCGMGSDLLQFARHKTLCTGIDLTPRSIEITRRRFLLYGEKADLLISDGEHLPFADESFDVIYSNGVLHHTPDTVGAIGEVHRVLRRGGVAKIMLYYRHSLNYWGEMILRRGILCGGFLRGQSPEEIMSRWVEFSEEGNTRPLVKVYSRREAHQLFKRFSEVKTEVNQMIRPELLFFSPFISDKLLKWLAQKIGWNLIITAVK